MKPEQLIKQVLLLLYGTCYRLEMCDIHEYEYYRDIDDGDMI